MADDDITAGWYTDSDGAIRWWDGAQWTEHVRTADDPEATAVLPADHSDAKTPRIEPAADEPDHRRRAVLIATFVGLIAFFLGMAIGGGNSPDPAVVDEATASSGATAEELDKPRGGAQDPRGRAERRNRRTSTSASRISRHARRRR